MTRVDIIPVELLTDKHLLSTYREITRVSKKSRPLADYGYYKMGKGHVLHFYNKGLYLAKHTNDLYHECIRRGFNVQLKIYRMHEEGLNEDWSPTLDDIYANLERIYYKISIGNYRYNKEPISLEQYKVMLEEWIEFKYKKSKVI